jgi:uncharacterized protein YfaS (alpha-2-macroglobulin family)
MVYFSNSQFKRRAIPKNTGKPHRRIIIHFFRNFNSPVYVKQMQNTQPLFLHLFALFSNFSVLNSTPGEVSFTYLKYSLEVLTMAYQILILLKRSFVSRKSYVLAGLMLVIGFVFFNLSDAQSVTPQDTEDLRRSARKEYKDGNYKDALKLYEKLLVRKDAKPGMVGNDLNMAINCLVNLNRRNETDDLREIAIEHHKDNWQLLWAAARSYQHADHSGYIIAGRFERGSHRGGGKYANALDRDRVRALQLMVQAMKIAEGDKNSVSVAGFYQSFAGMWLLNRYNNQASWELQALTDLGTLPDYEEGYPYWRGETRGAAVDEAGNPVFYQTPLSFESAENDGERWQWCLMTAVEKNPGLERPVNWTRAIFLKQQFGVQTMASYRWLGHQSQNEEEDESGTYAIHTLNDEETIAKLAAGVRRFNLPDEHNYIKIFKTLALTKGPYQTQSLQALAGIYENRRLYVKAANYWQRVSDLPNQSKHTYKQAREKLSQIKDNWGKFEPVMTQPHGKGATVEFRFRNAKQVDFAAFRINIPELLNDIKAYIKRRPNKLKRQKINVDNIGWRLVENNEKKYIERKAADWSMALSPRKGHWDRRVTVQTPLKKAGAYLLVATLPGGHTSRIIIWLNDTVIVHKPLDKKNLYFVADAVTGQPLSHVTLEFFGYRHQHVKRNEYKTKIKHFAEVTDVDGLVTPDPRDQVQNFQWLITATDNDGRFAHLGFNAVWHSKWYDYEYNQTKVFTITDRPVYRPGQLLKFKQWVRQAKYDQVDKSTHANRSIAIEIRNPKGDRIFEKSYTTDEFGGLNDEFKIPTDAPLGVYQINNKSYGQGGTFRVEEYKKPEFEVLVKAPKAPVMLGEKITAEINAKYYFGELVKEGKVKYKVLRFNHSAQWFPHGTWDWFYNLGYWWFAYDYIWYPGWYEWGCFRPWPWWVHRATPPPEVVAEQEIKIPENGIIKVNIDTRLAKEIHGDKDHRYEITAEVTDLSRRTIVGKGRVLVARRPFKVYSWVDRGHYRVGDNIRADFSAQTLDNRAVKGKGRLILYRISYDKDMQPIEKKIRKWKVDTDQQGRAFQQIKASEPGQYRLSYTVTDEKKHKIEGGYVFTIMGEGSDKKKFRFNHIELVTDKREYRPGDKVNLQINTDRKNGTVALFVRPANGVYLAPRIIRLKGKSTVHEIKITKKDMPNFFIEAFTIADGKIHSTTREVIVPPEKRILNLKIESSAKEYRPGEKAVIKLKLTDDTGEPFVGSTVVTVYDKALEYISGGSNVGDIKEFFWKWRRRHRETTFSNLSRYFRNLIKKKERAMSNLGVFGHLVANMELRESNGMVGGGHSSTGAYYGQEEGARVRRDAAMPGAPMLLKSVSETKVMGFADADVKATYRSGEGFDQFGGGVGKEGQTVQPTIRTKFADAAFWAADVTTDAAGRAEVSLTMPDNLTGWKVKTWAMGHGTKVGEAETTVTTKKNLMLRLQAPRFFIERDEVILSANVHNYLKTKKSVEAVLEIGGNSLEIMPGVEAYQQIDLAAGGEKRVDWRVKVVREGTAVIRMKALTDEESDAMEMTFPVYVHGADKMVAWSGFIRPDSTSETFVIDVPEDRRIDSSRLEIRYSPTLAGAMVDALPYLVDYPYGCTEQTLSRFLPTVITQKTLLSMGIDLKEIEKKRTNLNAQEIGADEARARQWKKNENTYDEYGRSIKKNPVFDEREVQRMVKVGVQALTEMQLSDGGWGWFSGYREKSWAHTTAYVVHGLQVARENHVALVPGMLERGIEWLENYANEQVRLLKRWDRTKEKGKSLGEYLYRDRNHLSVYAKSMAGMAYHLNNHHDRRDMMINNIEQYLVRDDENQTAYLNLKNSGYWWYWYGSEYEAHAYYLKLLAKTGSVHDWKAPFLVKYLLNNRKHATYWKSTRDTAIVIEAFADYLKATDELEPDLTLEILVDGKKMHKVVVNSENLFVYDNKFLLTGQELKTGEHTISIQKKGRGPIYFNAYLSYFSLEDFITKAGLEVKVDRKVYKLTSVDKSIKVAGSRGQVTDQKVEKYERELLENEAILKSGELVEVELVIDSKNDYEYLVFEDFKAAGFETVDVRSGYTGNEMGAYVEFRDNRVAFFVRRLARGRHSVSYRLRAEIPGQFSALPAKGYAMYAPELRGNSDEIKLKIED